MNAAARTMNAAARTMTDTANTVTDIAAAETVPVTAPALRLLGAAGAVCVDGSCSFDPTVGTDAP